MKKRWLCLCFVVSAMLVLSILNMNELQVGGLSDLFGGTDGHVMINEVMAINHTGIMDEDGDTGDWIELFNSGRQPVNLKGYGLSDKKDEPHLWLFPDVTVQPGEYLLVWADGKDRTNPGGVHTNFRISEGEVITLTNPSGTVMDSVHMASVLPDVSYGSIQGGPGVSFLVQATPRGGNSEAIEDISPYFATVVLPEFSRESGFYTEEFELSLSCDDPDGVIRYTLDGSEPTPDSPVYQDPIPVRSRVGEYNLYASKTDISIVDLPPLGEVFKATVVRARVFSSGALPGETVTHTFFIEENMTERYQLPVASLVTNPENLFDYETGIYVKGKIFSEWKSKNPSAIVDGEAPGNYNQRGREWEREASLTFFEPDGSIGFSQDVGIRTSGGWTRSNRHKSLRVIARNRYGQPSIEYPVFPGLTKRGSPDEDLNSFKQILFRCSGNDWEYSLLRDAMMQSLVAGLGVDTQSYRPMVLFVNGEFWGIHNIRETFDEHFIQNNYDVGVDDVVILEGRSYEYGMDIYFGREGDEQAFHEILDYVGSHDMTLKENYEYIANQIDVDNFILYSAAEIYFANTDWPGNNVKIWRKRTEEIDPDAPSGHDGRWRWLLYDTDFGFELYSIHATVSHNTLEFATTPDGESWPNPNWSTVLLRSLLTNEEFKTKFISQFVDLLNSRFHPDYVTKRIVDMREVIGPAMQEHMDRWRVNDGSMEQWKSQTNALIGFGLKRTNFITRDLMRYFGIDRYKISMEASDQEGGIIKMNDIEVLFKGDRWNGVVMEGIPVTLEAIPAEGYRFAGWESNLGFIEEPVTTLIPETYLEMKAIFVKD